MLHHLHVGLSRKKHGIGSDWSWVFIRWSLIVNILLQNRHRQESGPKAVRLVGQGETVAEYADVQAESLRGEAVFLGKCPSTRNT